MTAQLDVGLDSHGRQRTPVQIASNVFLYHDTCNVYVLRSGREAVLIDFGNGDVLAHLDQWGIDRVTDVLVTHHHRDVVQGLWRAEAAGIRVWVPPVERELFDRLDEHWASRTLDNDYDLRQDKFSLMEPVPVTGTVAEYRTRRYGDFDIYTLPTPGHTVGSVSYVVETDGRRLVFGGDLAYASGKTWSLAASQWTYVGTDGLAATRLSCMQVEALDPSLLLPAHGAPMSDVRTGLALLRSRLDQLIHLRRTGEPWDLDQWFHRPWEQVSPHLLRNVTSLATSFALLSDSGNAILLDFGYDRSTGIPLSADRSARRPLLACLDSLRRDFGVERIEAVIPTHYHDDHVAGFNLLREVEGTQVWAEEAITPVLEDPRRYDLPCLWYDPIPVDRSVPAARPLRWHEYELTMWPLPGHTLYAAAIGFEADGERVLVTGDQQDGGGVPNERPELLNFQYRNRFRIDDFVRSAELYRSLRPDVLISAHWWPPRRVTDDYLDLLLTQGRQLAALHRDLLPLEEVDFGMEGFGARIEPYRATVRGGEELKLDVTARNPFPREDAVVVQLEVPDGWKVSPRAHEKQVPARSDVDVAFQISPPVGVTARRARVTADLTVGNTRFGQQAEALVSVT